jgi:hypothetical protein
MLKIDSEQAIRHVKLLSGDGGSCEMFQVFLDKPNASEDEAKALGFGLDKNTGLYKRGTYRYGSYLGLENWLNTQQNKGCGVFIMVNECDGHGRNAKNVTAIRALFTDDDGKNPMSTLVTFNPQYLPSFRVKTAHGYHNYWLLQPGTPVGRFKAGQKQLASHFYTDPKVCDLPRVLRLSGSWHQKDPANPVQMILMEEPHAI